MKKDVLTVCYQVDPGYRHMGYPNKGELSMAEIRALQEKAREKKDALR